MEIANSNADGVYIKHDTRLRKEMNLPAARIETGFDIVVGYDPARPGIQKEEEEDF